MLQDRTAPRGITQLNSLIVTIVWCGGITGEAVTLQITKIIENGGENSIWREKR